MRASAENVGRWDKEGGERVTEKILIGLCGLFYMALNPQYAGIIFMLTGILIKVVGMKNKLDDIYRQLLCIKSNQQNSWLNHRQ